MMSVIKISTILLLLLLCSCSRAQRPITHLQLVQTWTPTFCTTSPNIKCFQDVGEKFAMHGLWPANSTGKAVVNCSKTNIPDSVLNELERELRPIWPNIVQGRTDRDLWNHEWKAHGSCTSMSVRSYFGVAIKLKNRIDLLSLLKNDSIIPSMDTTYKKTNIITAVQKGIGTNTTNVYVSCRAVNSTHVWLYEIFVCANLTEPYNYLSCPASSDTRGCGGTTKQNNIIFPTNKELPSSTDLHYEDEGESFVAHQGLGGKI